VAGFEWKWFGAYSGCCWAVPALIITSDQLIEFSALDTSLRPGYGLHNCWFNNAASLLVFVVTPLCVVMALNVVFFTWCAFLIYWTNCTNRHNEIANTEFLLYLRMALIMGLTWITGIIAGVVNLEGIDCFTLRRCLTEMRSDVDNMNIGEWNMLFNPLTPEAHINNS
jgi:hypothetical protein